MGIGVHNYGTDYSGTSVQRPLNPPLGEIFYDTTLEQLVMWAGHSWVRINNAWEAHTADDTLTAAETATRHDNTGDAGVQVLTLPTAVAGLNFLFRVVAAFAMRIVAASGETIALPSTGVQGTAGKYIGCATAGATLEVRCDTDGEWEIATYSGVWVAEA